MLPLLGTVRGLGFRVVGNLRPFCKRMLGESGALTNYTYKPTSHIISSAIPNVGLPTKSKPQTLNPKRLTPNPKS